MTATATQIALQPGDVIKLRGSGRYALVTAVVEVEGLGPYAGYRTIVGYGKPSERLAKTTIVLPQTVYADAVEVVERRPA
jgi:hypothetical protein